MGYIFFIILNCYPVLSRFISKDYVYLDPHIAELNIFTLFIACMFIDFMIFMNSRDPIYEKWIDIRHNLYKDAMVKVSLAVLEMKNSEYIQKLMSMERDVTLYMKRKCLCPNCIHKFNY